MSTLDQLLIREVYDNAVSLFKERYAGSKKKTRWLADKHTMEDVQTAIADAKAKYECRTQSKARKYLQKLSAAFVYYGGVMDMLAQQQPEYVSLAWGTMKLLFILVMNHDELTSELARALARISDVLPRLEFDLVLYPIDDMKRKMEDLYVLLIKFYQRALKWYEESRLKHALSAFVAPYKLHFEDIVQSIAELARSIDQLAMTLSRQEMRKIYHLVKQCLDGQESLTAAQYQSYDAITNIEQSQVHTLARLAELQQLLVSHQALNSGVLLNTQEMVRGNQVALMIAATCSASMPAPHDCLARLIAFHSRQRVPINTPMDPFLKNKRVKSWATEPGTSLLLVSGSLTKRSDIQALETYITEMVRTSDLPVLWAIPAFKHFRPVSQTEMLQ